MIMNILIFTKRQQVFSEMKNENRRYDFKASLSKDPGLETPALGRSSLCISHTCLT